MSRVWFQFLIGTFHRLRTSSSLSSFKVSQIELSSWSLERSFLNQNLPSHGLFHPEVSLNCSEELLHWINPWGVLRVEEHMHLPVFDGLQHELVLVYSSVVHEDNNVLIHVLTLSPDLPYQREDEVLEDGCVNATFHNLSRHDLVLRESCYH